MLIWILSHDIVTWYEESELFSKQYRLEFFLERGIELIVLDVLDFDFSSSTFLRYKKQELDSFAIVEEPIMPKVVWSRTSFDAVRNSLVLENCTHLFPSSLVSCLANDKWLTYRAFPYMQPETFLLSHVLHSSDLISHRNHDAIIKYRIWYGWFDVYKIALQDIATFDFGNKADDYIVQKFCDFTQ